MRPVAVVVLDVLVDHGFEMIAADYQHAIEALPADRANETLSEGVRTRCPDRSTNGSNVLGAEDLVEAGREPSVAIAGQEFDWSCTLGRFIGQVSGLLGHPYSCWMRRYSCHEDLSGVELDEEEDIEPVRAEYSSGGVMQRVGTRV
jgi:hypothetical protein